MGFHENAVYPDKLAYGSTFGPGFNTKLIRLDNGAVEAVARWQEPLYQGDLSTGLKTIADWADLRRFFIARRGAANGFRFEDPFDHTSNNDGTTAPTGDDQAIGTGDGSNKVFQLQKTYTDSGESSIRRIRKPQAGTVIMHVDGVPQSFGVDTATGIVTMASAPALDAVVTAGYEFHVPVRFAEDVDRALAATYNDFNSAQLPSIGIFEEPNDDYAIETLDYGGSYDGGSISSDALISPLNGRIQQFTPTTGGLDLQMPTTQLGNLVGGGPYVVFKNTSGVNSFDVVDEFDATIVTLTPGDVKEVWLMDNGNGAFTWYGF